MGETSWQLTVPSKRTSRTQRNPADYWRRWNRILQGFGPFKPAMINPFSPFALGLNNFSCCLGSNHGQFTAPLPLGASYLAQYVPPVLSDANEADKISRPKEAGFCRRVVVAPDPKRSGAGRASR